MLERRRHRLERLAGLRYHHKLVLSILIVFGILGLVLALAQDQETLKIESAYSAGDTRFPAYLSALLGVESVGGNSYDVLTNGDEIFPAMLDAIDHAQRRVSFESYIYEKGQIGERFTQALEGAGRRGVTVNVVVDDMGSSNIPDTFVDRMKAAGAHVGLFGKPKWYSIEELNYRTHRKILVVDGRVAFTGGVGVADHWLGHAQDRDHWRDTMIRITGPLARLMEGAFNENLIETLGPVKPIVDPLENPPPPTARDAAFVVRSSPTGGANDLKRLYLLAIGAAAHTLDICTPYFIVDESTEWALRQASARGVHVRLLVEGDLTDAKPVKYASRQAYERLMRAGLEIHEYQPTMMHTKVIVVDGAWSMFGSANFDNRSLELNDEMNVGVYDRHLASELLRDFENDLHGGRKLELQSWTHRSPLEKVREYFWSYFGEIF